MKFNTEDDPRRPGEIKPFQQRTIPEDELPVDMYSICALLLGMLGLMTRVSFNYSHNRFIESYILLDITNMQFCICCYMSLCSNGYETDVCVIFV